MDLVTEQVWHDCADHNHLLKRIAQHVTMIVYTSSDYEAFPYVLSDLLSGLNHATRRQSVRMSSYHVWSLERHGKAQWAKFIRVIAEWHESLDSRVISQLQRCWYNYAMLNFILEEWISWYTEWYTVYGFAGIALNYKKCYLSKVDSPRDPFKAHWSSFYILKILPKA